MLTTTTEINHCYWTSLCDRRYKYYQSLYSIYNNCETKGKQKQMMISNI